MITLNMAQNLQLIRYFKTLAMQVFASKRQQWSEMKRNVHFQGSQHSIVRVISLFGYA
jgi:hypothetical protein